MDLIRAYRLTIEDLEIARRSCGLFAFKKRREYTDLIEQYERRITLLEKDPLP